MIENKVYMNFLMEIHPPPFWTKLKNYPTWKVLLKLGGVRKILGTNATEYFEGQMFFFRSNTYVLSDSERLILIVGVN